MFFFCIHCLNLCLAFYHVYTLFELGVASVVDSSQREGPLDKEPVDFSICKNLRMYIVIR